MNAVTCAILCVCIVTLVTLVIVQTLRVQAWRRWANAIVTDRIGPPCAPWQMLPSEWSAKNLRSEIGEIYKNAAVVDKLHAESKLRAARAESAIASIRKLVNAVEGKQ